MVAYFCHHFLNNYVDLEDLYFLLSIVELSENKYLNYNVLCYSSVPNCHVLVNFRYLTIRN